MKLLLNLLFLVVIVARGQNESTTEIDRLIVRNETEAHISFLAADEMRGRDTGSPELQIAANYIRAQFRMNNVAAAPGTVDYFQNVDLLKLAPPTSASATVGDLDFTMKKNLLVLDGQALSWEGQFVYVGSLGPAELEKMDLKGKMIFALAGAGGTENVSINKVYQMSREKYATIVKRGALGLVEMLTFSGGAWPALVNYFSQPRWTIAETGPKVPFVWLAPSNIDKLKLKNTTSVKGRLSVSAPEPEEFTGKNVAAMVEGTDAKLKEEFVIMTAHYDHIGVKKEAGEQDSIFNGARDNATGTVALLQAAKYFARHPAKRSILFVAVTSEEKGSLGSGWYVKHPLVPLSAHVLNINSDGIGYNDKTRVTSISLGRTNLDDLIIAAAKDYGLAVGGDPDPREGFFERSDQVSFAREGIPAIKLQPGVTSMDESILKFYHRPADEASSLDFDYITTFYRVFIHAIQKIVNDPRTPGWTKGDKYEDAGKKRYGE